MLRDVILGTKDRKREPVATPEWPDADGKLFICELSAADYIAFTESLGPKDKRDMSNLWARLAVYAICDENGEKVFTPADAPALGQMSVGPLERIYDAAMRFSKLRAEDAEGLRKNS